MADRPTTAEASPTGIAECLRMLADEAASLRLVRTVLALLETVEICRLEAQAIPSAMPEVPAPSDGHLIVPSDGHLIVH